MATAWQLEGRAGQILRPRLISIGHLLSGNFLNAAIMLVSVAIAARALGPQQYGVMVLVLAFGRTIERLIRFESWQPLIRFAAEEEGSASSTRLGRLYAFGLLLDASTALISAVMAIALAAIGSSLAGLSGEHLVPIAIYSVALALNITGMPTAALRMAGRFRTIAYALTASNLLRVLLAVLCFVTDAGLFGFILAWTVAQASGALLFLWLGFRALRTQGITNPLSVPMGGLRQEFPDFLPFAWSTNLSTMLRTLTHEADALLVGALAGPAAAGFYHIAKRVAKVAQQVGAQVQTVIYPDVARMWWQGDRRQFRSTTRLVQLGLAAAGGVSLLIVWLFGEWLIKVGPGDRYLSAYPLLLVQLVAVILTMHSAPARSALLAMDRPRLVLLIALVATIIFLVTSVIAIPALGAMGANIGHIALAGVAAILMDIAWLRASRKA